MAAPLVAGLGRLLLHGGAHAPGAEPAAGIQAEYFAISAAVVGLGGGVLYWYYGRRLGSG